MATKKKPTKKAGKAKGKTRAPKTARKPTKKAGKKKKADPEPPRAGDAF